MENTLDGIVTSVNADIAEVIKLQEQLCQCQEALRLKNLEFNTLIENIPGGIHRCRLFGDICLDFASDSLCELTGWSADEINNLFDNDYARLVHPEDQEGFSEVIGELSKNPGSITTEYRICRKDGSVHWVSDTIRSVCLEDGKMWGFAIVTDIDESKRERLKLQALMDTFPGAVVQYKFVGVDRLVIDYMNESTAALLGYSPEEYASFENQDPLSFLYEKDIHAVTNVLLGLIKADIPGECICRLQAKSELIWVKVRFTTVIREKTHIYITAVFFDITEELKMQHQRQWNDERYRLLVEDSGATTVDYDPLTDILLYRRNIQGKNTLQQEMPDFLKTLETSGFRADEHVTLCRGIVAGLCEKAGRQTVELRVKLRERLRWCRLQLVSIAGEDHEVYRIIGKIDDIQPEKDKEEELKAALTREEAFRCALTEGAVLAFVVDGDTWKIIPSSGDIIPELYKEETDAIKFLEMAIRDLVHPEDRKIAHVLLEEKCNYQKDPNGFYVEFRAQSFDDSSKEYRWFGAYRRRLLDTEPGHTHYLIYTKDIHGKKIEELALREKASMDALTGIINRSSFEELSQREIASSIESGGTVGFLLIDLDDFKNINDTYGHLVGDKVLINAAKELRALFRQNDLVARLGGDELAVLLTGFQGYDLLHKKAAAICESMTKIQVDGKPLPISCSVGISVFPQHGNDFSNLYHHADLALYQAKQSGKNQYCVYGQDVNSLDMGVWMDKEWLMDNIGVLIYICDVKTYELIYMSKALCKKYNISNYKNCKCYEVLQGRSSPCEFCTNSKLVFDEFYCWEYRNPRFNLRAILKDKLIHWNGRAARMEVITEITG